MKRISSRIQMFHSYHGPGYLSHHIGDFFSNQRASKPLEPGWEGESNLSIRNVLSGQPILQHTIPVQQKDVRNCQDRLILCKKAYQTIHPMSPFNAPIFEAFPRCPHDKDNSMYFRFPLARFVKVVFHPWVKEYMDLPTVLKKKYKYRR